MRIEASDDYYALLGIDASADGGRGHNRAHPHPAEAAQGGMITISMRVLIRCAACPADSTASCTRCGGTRSVEDLFSAWLAVLPDIADGTILTPSAQLGGI